MPRHVTADQFASQLKEAGYHGSIDRSVPGVTYVRVENVHGDPRWAIYAVFEGDRFSRASDIKVGVPRLRWRTYRSMAAVWRALGVEKPRTAKPRTLRRDSLGFGYETSDGRYKVIPAYTPSCTSLGGRTHRPSYWILKDRQGERATIQRTLLRDIRDLLRECP